MKYHFDHHQQQKLVQKKSEFCSEDSNRTTSGERIRDEEENLLHPPESLHQWCPVWNMENVLLSSVLSPRSDDVRWSFVFMLRLNHSLSVRKGFDPSKFSRYDAETCFQCLSLATSPAIARPQEMMSLLFKI